MEQATSPSQSNANRGKRPTLNDFKRVSTAMGHESMVDLMCNVVSGDTSTRRKKIFAEALDVEDESFHAPVNEKTIEQTQFLKDSLAEHFLFDPLSDSELLEIVQAFEKEVFVDGSHIISQGDIGEHFYVVEDGFVAFHVDGKEVGGCGRGASFGELALIYNCPRTASCFAAGKVTIWKVHQKTFRMILASDAKKGTDEVTQILRKVPFLKELQDLQLKKIVDTLMPMTFTEGKKIVKKGQMGKVFYIVKEGTVRAHDIGHGDSEYQDRLMGPGDFFGERALLTGEPRTATVTAVTDCTTLCLSRDAFKACFGDLKTLMNTAHRKRVLTGVPNIASSNLKSNVISQLTDMFEEVTFEEGTFLLKEGEQISNQGIYIIEEGKVRMMDSYGVITTMAKEDHFGGETIKCAPTDKSDYTIQILEKTTCAVLTKERIESVVGSVTMLGRSQSLSKKLLNMDFDDLTIVHQIGAGSFGKVSLVTHNETQKKYALKKMSKRNILDNHQGKAVMRERNIMASIQHPLIINLISTFQDKNNLYMVLDLVGGGELFDITYRIQVDEVHKYGVSHTMAKFYTACLLESLSHVHSQYIAYRDLKPENVLVDKQGYSILIDFGFAKVVMDKTFTMCGTPEYLAPEILLSKGYNTNADNWALGILAFELLAGYTPFFKKGLPQIQMFRSIVRAKFKFPENKRFCEASKDLISRLLVRNLNKRIGNLAGGENDIKNHPFFHAIDFEKVRDKKYEAPYIPGEKPKKPKPPADDGDGVDMVIDDEDQAIFEDFGKYI